MKLTTEEVRSRLAERPGWAFEHDALERQFTFAGFPDAVAFVVRLAFDAEAHDHHPDLTISYKRVRVVWSTHSEGGVTVKDFAGAAQADEAAGRLGARA